MLIKSVYEQAAIKQSPPSDRERDRQRPGKYLSPIIVPAKLEAKNGVDTTNIGFIIALVHRFAAFSIHWSLNDGLYERNERRLGRFTACAIRDNPDGNHRRASISAKMVSTEDDIIRSSIQGTRVTSTPITWEIFRTNAQIAFCQF